MKAMLEMPESAERTTLQNCAVEQGQFVVVRAGVEEEQDDALGRSR